MDTKRLETIRITALQHVQRYNLAYPSSTTCRSWHERSLLRYGDPCTPKSLWDTRFAFKVTRGSEGAVPIYMFDLLQAAIDAALIELLIDGCKKRLADCRAFVEEANKAMRPGPALKNRSRSGVLRSMKLTERKHIFIDISRSQHPEATCTSPPAELSLADFRFMQSVLELDKEDIYDIARHDSDSPEPNSLSLWERARVRVERLRWPLAPAISTPSRAVF